MQNPQDKADRAQADGEPSERTIALAREGEFRLGPLRFAPSSRQMFVNGETETLEPRVMQVLTLLAEHRGEVVSRDELVRRCWDGRAVSEDAINRAIAKVRRISEAHEGYDLETIPRVGYRLVERQSTAGVGGGRRRRYLVAALVACALFLSAAAALWFVLVRPGAAEPEPVALAVLPFRNLASGDSHFAEGVAEEILTQLARQPGLRVVGRTSAWMFREQADSREIGRRLDVAYILEGSVRRVGERVRIDVALVGTGDGMRRWSQGFEGTLDDIFAIQEQIGNAVAGNLSQQIVLSFPTRSQLRTSGDVYNLHLVARGLLRTREPARMETAKELLQSAVRLDPDYAPAWAALGSATILGMQNVVLEPAVVRERANEARGYIRRALALAPDLAEAHMALYQLEPHRPEAIPRLERAVALEPTNAEYWYLLGNVRAATVDHEGALEAWRRTAAIDPFWVRASAYATLAWYMGERQTATEFEERLATLHPEPVARVLARMRLAAYRQDWSEAYRLANEADRLRPAEVRAVGGPFLVDPVFLRVRLGKLSELPAMMRFPWVIDMISGAPPDMAQVRRTSESPRQFWERQPMTSIVALRLNQHGRGSELAALYDAAFSSPDAMIQAQPPMLFLDNAPFLVVALRSVGRSAEADRLLAEADRLVGPALAAGRPPRGLIEIAARVRALQGRPEEAIRLLERAVALGWQFDQHGMVPLLADDPVYAGLAADPRLRRLDRILQQAVERERREAQSMES